MSLRTSIPWCFLANSGIKKFSNSTYYTSTEIYSKQSCQIKMVCQNLQTIWLVIRFFSLVKNIVCGLWLVIRYFSLEKKNGIGFPAFRRGFPKWECSQQTLLPLNRSWFQGLQTLFQSNNLSKTMKMKTQKRKLNRMLLCLRNFWRWRTSIMETYKRNSPNGAECIHQRIYHYGTKERRQRRLSTQLLTFFDGQFWTVFKEEEFNISVKSLNQSPTLTFPETEMKSTTRYKRLKVLDSDSELKKLSKLIWANVFRNRSTI